MPRDKDELTQEQIFLGGQVSNKHKIFQEIAHLDPDMALAYYVVKHHKEWKKKRTEEGRDKVVLELIELLGVIDFMKNTTELTRLSMIMGDTRSRFRVVRPAGTDPST